MQVGGLPLNIEPEKARVFALGPDVTLAIAKGGKVYGFARVCYQWETYARAQTQGGAWNILVTMLPRPVKVPGGWSADEHPNHARDADRAERRHEAGTPDLALLRRERLRPQRDEKGRRRTDRDVLALLAGDRPAGLVIWRLNQ
jgi:hypothetical protein